jgi:large subunit ribosomal protein L17e
MRPTNAAQVRYAAVTIDNAKSARARGSYLRTSFKNTRETAQAINGWKLERALTFLGNVLEKKEAVPMRRYAGSTGRTAQGEWPLLDRAVQGGIWSICDIWNCRH